MEFIPLEKCNGKNKTKILKKCETVKNRKTTDEVSSKETNLSTKFKPTKKKNVKNKYKETLALKQQEIKKKKIQKQKKIIASPDNNEELEEKEKEIEKEEKMEGNEEEINLEEEAFKRKCKEMDEKKKNRLFVKLKKKIYSDAQIKELHPDIKQVIFPRKKNSRWCWAVFASEESANTAMKQLIKNKDVFVSKPNPYDRVYKKNMEKMKTVLMKKEKKKKLQKLWM